MRAIEQGERKVAIPKKNKPKILQTLLIKLLEVG
jgi:hypothetical protein